MMMRLFAMIVIALCPSLLSANNKKELKEGVRQVISILQMEELTKAEVPRVLLDDEAASEYCRNVLYLSDEEYSKDTARINSIIRDAQWIIWNQIFPDEALTKKLTKQKVNPEKLYDIYDWANKIMQNVHPRYGIMTGYCNKQLQRRREALQQTMPEGRLISFSYREYGSSRPTPIEYVLRRDDTSGYWMLNGKAVADSVADEVRAQAERYQIYKCMKRYEEQPNFPKSPLLLGGPPSWSFDCQFEGGSITSGSECMPVPGSCAAIVAYLRQVLEETVK